MDKHGLEFVTEKIQALFPKSDWTPDIFELMCRRLQTVSLSREQVNAILEEHKYVRRSKSPNLRQIVDAMKAASNLRTNYVAQRGEQSPAERDREATDRADRMRGLLSQPHPGVACDFKRGKGLEVLSWAEYKSQAIDPFTDKKAKRQ